MTDWVKDTCKKILRDASIPPPPAYQWPAGGYPVRWSACVCDPVRVNRYVWWNQCTPPATLDGQLGCRVKAVRTIRSQPRPRGLIGGRDGHCGPSGSRGSAIYLHCLTF